MNCSPSQRQALEKVSGEIAFDNLTRQLYATDASIYQIEPAAVAFPRNAQECAAIIGAAAEHSLPITPRGSGSGLAGGAIGEGLIVEFARFNRAISNLDLERRTVRAGSGVVLDQLNKFLKPHGYCFGPDVATSSRASIGGMIANNSSGSHVPVYGCTVDHVQALEVVLADGRIENLSTGGRFAGIEQLTAPLAGEINARMPADLLKRWPGYGLDRYIRQPNASHLLAGSEGTLAAILSAELKIVPLPRCKTLGLIFFASVAEAMSATVALLDLKPAAIEHIDRVLFDQTRGQLNFKAARDLLELDAKPCEAILLVEFFDDEDDRLALLPGRNLGLRTLLLRDPAAMNLVWNMRKAGLSLLTGCAGDAKPVTAIEDTAVRPQQLPEYVAALQSILQRQNLRACFYGHAASGLLHVRPVLDLHNAGDLRKFRQVSDEVAQLVREFKGSLAAEHGVGIARTEYMPGQLGPLLDLMRQIKNIFDPNGLFNPGKLFPDGRYHIDRDLRMGADYKLPLPFEPVLAFAAKDHSFTGNLEQCNGCGGCRKETPTMCPTFLATGEEIMSTRGRANTIRAALEQRGLAEPLISAELDAALSNCLSCKACTPECPSNVNLALLKAELLHARQQKYGVTLKERLFSNVDLLGQLGCLTPRLANRMLRWPLLRRLMEKLFNIAPQRPLPPYALERFDHWFARRPAKPKGARGKIYLWDDTFARYHEPNIAQAAVAVLEAAGFTPALVKSRRCCGRPAFSQGCLEQAAELGRHNLKVLTELGGTEPILFLEPSCYSMFAEDYAELKLAGAEEIKARCFLFEDYINRLLKAEPGAIAFAVRDEKVAIHAHCHAKSLLNPSFMKEVVECMPGRTAVILDTGCCGMAGAFGALSNKYELSRQVAQPLLRQVEQQKNETVIVASGTSCRHQLEHLSPVHPRHMAEVLAHGLAANQAVN